MMPASLSPAKQQCRENGARQMPSRAVIREARNVRDLDVGGYILGGGRRARVVTVPRRIS